MAEKSIDLGLTALDELFMTDEGRKESKLPRIYDIPLDQIDDMPNHPFKVREDDEDMDELMWGMYNAVMGLPLDKSHRWFNPVGCAFSQPEMICGTYLGHEGVPSVLTIREEDGRLVRIRDGAQTEFAYCGGARFLSYDPHKDYDQGVRHEFLIRDGKAWGVRCGTRVFERME